MGFWPLLRALPRVAIHCTARSEGEECRDLFVPGSCFDSPHDLLLRRCHCCFVGLHLELLKTLRYPLVHLHVFLHAVHGTLVLFVSHVPHSEVVDAVRETQLGQFVVGDEKVFELFNLLGLRVDWRSFHLGQENVGGGFCSFGRRFASGVSERFELWLAR